MLQFIAIVFHHVVMFIVEVVRGEYFQALFGRIDDNRKVDRAPMIPQMPDMIIHNVMKNHLTGIELLFSLSFSRACSS